jgi:cytochrome c oxidase cbb3-type subunit 4
VDYESLRHFADSWGLLALTLVFVGVIAWVLRPGARRHYQDQANIPFKHDDGQE